jgi:hypothetical protein
MQTVAWEILLDNEFADIDGDIDARILEIDFDTLAQNDPQFTEKAAKQAALWAQIERAIESLRCGTRFQDGSTNKVLVQRSPDFDLNVVHDETFNDDDRVHFTRGNKFWSIANDVAPFMVSGDDSWIFDDDKIVINGSIPAEFLGDHAPFISQQRAINGWRWVQLSEPVGSYVQEGNAFVGGDADPYQVWHPVQQIFMHVDITRNKMGSTATDYTYNMNKNDGMVTLELVDPISGGDADTVFGEPEYSLNMLLEYSNETVLMSQERGKPVHLSNLVLPGLPRQE